MTRPDDAALPAKVGAVVRRRRESAGLSQSGLAVMMQADRTYISRIEAGERLPSVAMLLDLSDALDVGIAELLGRDR